MIQYRKQLREKVELRQKQLEETLKVSETSGHTPERLSALQTQLAAAKDALGAGWEKMTDTSAQRLTKWLDSTISLIPGQN